MAQRDRHPLDDKRQRRAWAKLEQSLAGGGAVVNGETPSGAIDGTNDTFTLSSTPIPGSIQVFRNGLFLREGASNDYTVSGTQIIFTADALPQPGSVVVVNYTRA
jgi:hypothetical protein